ncbi:hypothetical protein AGOR_G00163740 [Albula goreensis]|uniref:Ig-like domain-containing protein n=1 Tax=Albula goreensis TaxID=1534307 RepID=A0A8T3D0N0_9TELE|nr:hypothetical protein AGOR_G00163740 [Albula goreensis]
MHMHIWNALPATFAAPHLLSSFSYHICQDSMGLLIFTIVTAVSLAKIHAKDDISPAKILGKHSSTVGDEVVFICSTFGFNKDNTPVHVYLCKNGVGIQRKYQSERTDITFIINSVKREDSGNYTCVFSKAECKPSNVTGKGDNSVTLQVSAGFLPGDIALTETSVKGGSDVELTCTVSDTRSTDLNPDRSYTYLCKDGAAVQIKLWDRRIHGAIFTLKRVTAEDSGNYSCILFVSKLLSSKVMELHGNNAVELQIHGAAKGAVTEAVVGVVSVLLISSVMLGLWRWRQLLKQAICKNGDERHSISSDVPPHQPPQNFGAPATPVYDSDVWDDVSGYSRIDEWREQRREANQRDLIGDDGTYNTII